MIHEIRSYDLKPGSLATYIERVSKVIEERVAITPLVGYFSTEVGPINRVIHIWQYEDINQRNEVRAKAAEGGNWPPATGDLIHKMQSEICIPAPFLPKLEINRNIGPLFELRSYTYPAGAIPKVIDAWATKIDARMELSEPVGIWSTEFGGLNKWMHMWSYKSYDQRAEARKKFPEIGWPPASGVSALEQETSLLNAMPFSPVQ
ncbi:MAG: NIPSNAP family protein [Chloroflexi bacterium]|nr:NIPSNAP family protein [Chloroflexota bacterium]